MRLRCHDPQVIHRGDEKLEVQYSWLTAGILLSVIGQTVLSKYALVLIITTCEYGMVLEGDNGLNRASIPNT